MHIALLRIDCPGACNAQGLKDFSLIDERRLCLLDPRGRHLKKAPTKIANRPSNAH